jgi:serine/threonine protein kinase
MSAPVRKRGFLLNLAAEAIAPVVPGCARVLGGGSDRAINFFGQRIAWHWADWMRGQHRSVQLAALADLSDLPPDRARREAVEVIEAAAPEAASEDRAVAIEYLCALQRSVPRSLVLDQITGAMILPAGQDPDDPHTLLRLLPSDVPPYPPGTELPGTPYRLGELLGTGGFGAVYRATAASLQHLTFALKFCLDRSMVAMLQRERENLERLIEAVKGRWTDRIVRLYGYDLDHPTPFLVYEYVPGGDLTAFLTNLKQQTGRGFAPDEVFGLVKQVAEALAFAHERGLVHRDLKPANVLVSGDTIKLADFGLGGVVARHAAQHSRIGSSVFDQLTSDEQVSLFRGAGTPLYMSPEQRRGEPPDPRHDLYSLGVMWFQLLVGDVTRELPPGWARELAAQFKVPGNHLVLLEKCVGWIEDRPRDAGALLAFMQEEPAATPAAAHHPASTALTAEEVRETKLSKQRLLLRLKGLLAAHEELKAAQRQARALTGGDLLIAVLAGLTLGAGLFLLVGLPWWGALIVALLVCIKGSWWLLQNKRKQAEQARQALVLRADRLVSDNPDEVQAWGGRKVLLIADIVHEIIGTLETEMGSPAVP